jgi:ribosomal-protein-alanine N-acetyltransferase
VTRRVLRQDVAAMLADSSLRNLGHLPPRDPAREEEFFTAAGQEAEIAGQAGAGAAGTSLPVVLAPDGVVIGRVNLSGITRGPFGSGNKWLLDR